MCKLPILQKVMVVFSATSVGTGTGLVTFHIATTTPGLTPLPTPVTGAWQEHTLGYKAKTSAQLIFAQAHTLAYSAEPVPVDSVTIHSKLVLSAAGVVNDVNNGLPFFIKSKPITSNIKKKKRYNISGFALSYKR
jgi:hypothetical protein